MKVLLVHNFYQQPGGEDQVFAAEASLLEAHGHQTIRYTVHNNQVEDLNKVQLATATVWNGAVYKELRSLMQRTRPQLVHFHNTFPLISPSAYFAAKHEGISVVQTLHNYRLLCPNALFFRKGTACEDCLGKMFPWPGIVHSCYRGDFVASSGVATMLGFHRALGTWKRNVNVYVVLTEFAKKKFVQGGIPSNKIMVKPNFVYPTPEIGTGQGQYALFVGRLSQEKGVTNLLAAWKHIGEKLPIKIVGDGPLGPQVSQAAKELPGITWLGHQPSTEVYDLIGNAMFLIFPSKCYETFGRIIIESFAKGTPVITANIGATAELVEDGRTGLHFRTGDTNDIVKQVEWAISHQPELHQMRKRARTEFENKYASARNYKILMKIYDRAIDC